MKWRKQNSWSAVWATSGPLRILKKSPWAWIMKGTPVLLKNVADIHLGPELRRGILEWDGEGEAAGGIIVMRYGENARDVIQNVKTRLKELEKGLPEGVHIVTGYDRSGLIERAVLTLKKKLIEELTVVAIICVIFLLHLRSAFVALFTIPVGVLMAFIIIYPLGINANIMSLGGIAIAIGVYGGRIHRAGGKRP